MRRFTSTVSLALAALVLTGCGSAPATVADARDRDGCTPALPGGIATLQLGVNPSYGTVPAKIHLPHAGKNPATQVAVLNADDHDRSEGRRAAIGDIVGVDLALVDGKTGKTLYRGKTFGTDHAGDVFQVQPHSRKFPVSIGTLLKCAAPGERLAVALSPKDAEPLAQHYPLTPGAPAMAVIDVKSVGNAKEHGEEQALPNGFPAVTVDHNGVPGVVMPPQAPPKDLRVAQRYAGTGSLVTSRDSLLVQVQAIDWNGTMPQGDVWSQGPQALPPVANAPFPWRKKLNGMREGALAVVLEPNPQTQTTTVIILKILAAVRQ